MRCPSCNFENREGIRFCENCGNTFPQLPQPVIMSSDAETPSLQEDGLICPNCKWISPAEAIFCMQCGESFYEEDDAKTFSLGANTGGCMLFALKSIFLVILGFVTGWLIIFVF